MSKNELLDSLGLEPAENVTKKRFVTYSQYQEFLKDDTTRCFIELYPCGHNRVIDLRDTPESLGCVPPKPKPTTSFTDNARRRYYRFLMSLHPDENKYICLFSVLTFPREINKHFNVLKKHQSFLDKKSYKLLIKRFYQQLNRIGIDVVTKTEFCKDRFPHIHLIMIGSEENEKFYKKFCRPDNIEIFKKYIVLDEMGVYRFSIRLFRVYIAKLWCDYTYRYVNDFSSLQVVDDNGKKISVHCKFFKACFHTNIIQDWGKIVHYLANYVSKKDKTYQNTIPEGWEGLRFTNKAFRNYSDFGRKNKTVENDIFVGYEIIPITGYQCDKLQIYYSEDMKRKYQKKTGKEITVYKKNGFFVQNLFQKMEVIENERQLSNESKPIQIL